MTPIFTGSAARAEPIVGPIASAASSAAPSMRAALVIVLPPLGRAATFVPLYGSTIALSAIREQAPAPTGVTARRRRLQSRQGEDEDVGDVADACRVQAADGQEIAARLPLGNLGHRGLRRHHDPLGPAWPRRRHQDLSSPRTYDPY